MYHPGFLFIYTIIVVAEPGHLQAHPADVLMTLNVGVKGVLQLRHGGLLLVKHQLPDDRQGVSGITWANLCLPSVEVVVDPAFLSACALLNAVIYQGRIIMPFGKGERSSA